MAKLSDITYSVMRDLLEAQHEANIYSASLRDNYIRSGKLEDFFMPTMALSEIELDIHYGISDVDDASTIDIIINSSELSNIPQSSINSLHLKIKPESMNMQIANDVEDGTIT